MVVEFVPYVWNCSDIPLSVLNFILYDQTQHHVFHLRVLILWLYGNDLDHFLFHDRYDWIFCLFLVYKNNLQFYSYRLSGYTRKSVYACLSW